MNYHDITDADMLNGEGLRVVLWVAGCSHRCPGCQNPQTWDKRTGVFFDEAAETELFDLLAQPHHSGITFSGGDPLDVANREEVTRLAKKIRSTFGDSKTIWIYTGYTHEEVADLEVLGVADVLIDGRYVAELASRDTPWIGSSNQRIIKLK